MENSYIKYHSIARKIYKLFNWITVILSATLLVGQFLLGLIFGTGSFPVWAVMLFWLIPIGILLICHMVQKFLLEISDKKKSTATAILSGLIGGLPLLLIFLLVVLQSIEFLF